MNALELIAEVVDIVDDEGYGDTTVLKYLNQSQRAIADKVLLPDLKNGFDTIEALPSVKFVDLPSDYHRGLYLAFVDGAEIDIHADIKSLSMVNGGLTVESGDIACVAKHGGTLLYQKIPTTPTEIELYYYQKPVDMTDSDASYPDGANGNDDFDWALISFSAHKIFDIMEDGIEGPKVNASSHHSNYVERLKGVDDYATLIGKSVPTRPKSGLSWLGW